MKEYPKTTLIFLLSTSGGEKYIASTSMFCSSKIGQRKYIEMTSIFRPPKLHRRKYVETTWKFIEIFFSKYQRNIDIELTLIRRDVSIRILLLIFVFVQQYKTFLVLYKITNLMPMVQVRFTFTIHSFRKCSLIFLIWYTVTGFNL